MKDFFGQCQNQSQINATKGKEINYKKLPKVFGHFEQLATETETGHVIDIRSSNTSVFTLNIFLIQVTFLNQH